MGRKKGKKKTNLVSSPKKPKSKPLLVVENEDTTFLPSSLDGIDSLYNNEDQMVCYDEPLHKELGGKEHGGEFVSTPLSNFTTPLRRIRDAVLDRNGELSCICSGFHEEFCEICIDDASSFTGDERDVETRFEDVRSSSTGAIITKRDLDKETKALSVIPCDLQFGKFEAEEIGARFTPNHSPKVVKFDYTAAFGFTSPAHKPGPGNGEKGSGNILCDLTDTPPKADNSAGLEKAENVLSLGLVNSPLTKHVTAASSSVTSANSNLHLGHRTPPARPILVGPNEAATKGIEGGRLQHLVGPSLPNQSCPVEGIDPSQTQKEGNTSTPIKPVFRVPLSISEKGNTKWEHSIVGHFLGPYSPLHHVKIWAEKVLKCVDTRALEKGFFILTFKNEDEVEKVLKGGPYFLGNKLFVIKKWTPGMRLTKGKFSTIPLWVKLRGIPIDLWTEEGLNYLASLLGKPIQVDETSLKGSRMKFARICIEIDASKEVMKKFDVDLGLEEPSEIRVEVPWKPIKCKICEVFGHSSIACYKNPIKTNEPKHTWKRKKNSKTVKRVEEATKRVEPKIDPPREYPWLTKVKGKYVEKTHVASSPAQVNEKGTMAQYFNRERVPPDIPIQPP